MDRRIRQVINAQKRVFESLGCIVEEAEPDFSGSTKRLKTLRAWNFALNKGADAKRHRELVKDTILWEVDRGEKLTAMEVGQAETKGTELYHRVRRFMDRYEFFVLPVNQVQLSDVGQYVTEIEGVVMKTYIDWMKSCYYISTIGNPALSVPCGFTPEGLPVGIQIVGRYRDDWGLLQMGHESVRFGLKGVFRRRE